MAAPVTPSQTVGPFFGVGLPFEHGEELAPPGAVGVVRVEGQVFDGNGDPVPDALLEIWQPDAQGRYGLAPQGEATGFGRCRTDAEGAFSFVTVKPGRTQAADGRLQAPHLNITVFARGLLRHLVTRMYFPDEAATNADDPVLNLVAPARRPTLLAEHDGGVLRFDVRLQGDRETVFFAI
jgi:protocatechuate 3,4-dioxygenase, alpha subunit